MAVGSTLLGRSGIAHRWLFPAISISICIVVWETLSRLGFVNPFLFPPPTSVGMAFREWIATGEFATDAATSCSRAIIGLALGGAMGVLTGIATGRSRVLNATVAPLIQLLRPLPPVAIIPVVIVWLGIDNVAKIFSIGFGVFFPVWINSHIGAARIPDMYLWNAQAQRRSRWIVITRIVVPAALPSIVAGVRTAISVAFIMVFVTELAGASSGIGYQVSVSHLAYRIDKMMAGLIALGAVGAAADWCFAKLITRLFPWINKA